MKTLLPVTALIALVAAGPLAWAQDSHETPNGDNAKAEPGVKSDAQASTPDTNRVAMTNAQPTTICNTRNGTVACGAKSIPHEPGVPPVNPANQAPAPAQ